MKKRRSLYIQLSVYCAIVFMSLWGVITGLNYWTSSQTITEMTQQSVSESIDQAGQMIQHYLKQLSATATSLATANTVKQFAINDTNEQKETTLALIHTLLDSNPDLVSAVIVTKDGRILSNETHFEMAMSQDMMQQDWYRQAIEHPMMPVLTSARQQRLDDNQDNWVISITQEIADDTGRNLGVVRLDIRYQTLENTLNQLKLGEQGVAYIMTEGQQLVYHPNSQLYQDAAAIQALIAQTATQGIDKEGHAYVHHYQFQDIQWRLVGVASLSRLTQVQQQLLMGFIISGGLTLMLGVVGLSLLIKRWLKPLNQLQQTMQQVEERAILASKADVSTIDSSEIYNLALHYNHMLERIQQLVGQIQEKEQAARHYELMALNSQINPHFLYNTLDAIIWMAEFKDNERVIELTQALAKYFRLALNQGQDIMKLSDEFEHVRQYLFIQQQRYGEKLSYELILPDELAQLTLPKLVLQPLVENALYHGVKPVNRKGHIRVVADKISETQMTIRIEDNGAGFSQTEEDNKTPKLGGVGLANVTQRLQLYFGEAFELQIESKENQFTHVTLYIPLSHNSNTTSI